MDTFATIAARRDVRRFDPAPLAPDRLDRLLDAARRSPSSQNWQPWDHVLVTDRAQLEELSKVWRGAGHVATSAATVALVTRDFAEGRERETAAYDLGQLTAHLMLAAADLGIGSGHSAVEDQDLARRVLRLPEDRRCAYLVPLGVPADRPLSPVRRPDRRPLEEVVHRGSW